MENRSIFIVTAAGTFVGTIAVIIIEKWKRIMGYVADPEVKSSLFASVAIIIGLYIVLYGCWRLVVKPYIDKKFDALKRQTKYQNELLKRDIEILQECVGNDLVRDVTIESIRKKCGL